MKSFSEYLTESKKVYQFKLGFAGELPEGFEEKLRMGLSKYGLVNLSKGKSTPINKRPLDFPNLQNTEVTYFETDVNYPTTTEVLTEYLSNLCVVPRSHVIVHNLNDPLDVAQEEKTEDKPYEAMLNTEELGGENAQGDVGGNRVMELLKELEKARQEREIDPIEGAPAGESKDIGDAENSKAVVGG